MWGRLSSAIASGYGLQPVPQARPEGGRSGDGRWDPSRHRRLGDMGVPGRLTIRHVQPRSAVKAYLCPGCGWIIPAGRFHLLVVPVDDPDLRRHWHHGCWYKEQRKLMGRRKRSGDPSMPLELDPSDADHHGDQIYSPNAY